jgi:hypothetical protein
VHAPRANDGVMSYTKSHRKLASEMREAQLKKEKPEAQRRARLKVETTLAVAAFSDGPRATSKGRPTIR